jgi:hypothetical protein
MLRLRAQRLGIPVIHDGAIMTTPTIRSLKTNLEVAAVACRISYGEFARSRGIRDFLLDAEGLPDDPRDLVAAALESLTVGDKGNKMDFATCVAAVGCLDECIGAPTEDRDGTQRLTDLARLVAERGNAAQYRLWATTWYD